VAPGAKPKLLRFSIIALITAKVMDIEPILEIARQAGKVIMEVYARDFAVESKEDKSPLTEADRLANDVIVSGLRQLHPDIPIISEETKTVPYAERKDWTRYWLVDPLDGTKEFIKKNGEFTVNIALVVNGEPALGVVYQPAAGTLYAGSREGGSFKIDAQGQRTALAPGKSYLEKQTVRVVASRSHMTPEVEEFVAKLQKDGREVELTSSGSSLKLCMVAEGTADVYPRFGPTMEWDTAAAHAVALHAGRQVLNHETGGPLLYNKENLLNPWFIVQ